MGNKKKVIYSAMICRRSDGRMKLSLSRGMPEYVEVFYKNQWRDFFRRKKRQKEDPSYDPIWNPIQAGFEMVYTRQHNGIILSKEE